MAKIKNIVKGVGAVIKNSSGKVLLSYRKPDTLYGDCWFIPCGTVEKNENPKEAIARETEEELGVVVDVGKKLSERMNRDGFIEIVYLCKIIKGTPKNKDPEEVSEIKYFPLKKLPKNIHPFIAKSINKLF